MFVAFKEDAFNHRFFMFGDAKQGSSGAVIINDNFRININAMIAFFNIELPDDTLHI